MGGELDQAIRDETHALINIAVPSASDGFHMKKICLEQATKERDEQPK